MNKINIFVEKFFNELNRKKVNYAILRNYNNLPFKDKTTEYFDLDLLIDSSQYNEFLKLLNLVSKSCELQIAKIIKREYVKTIQIFYIEKNCSLFAIQIDAHIYGQNWWGNFYLCEKEILANKTFYKNYFVVSNFHQELIKWLDKLFWGNYVKLKYINGILSCFEENEALLKDYLLKVFGPRLSSNLLTCIKNNDLNSTLYFRKKMIRKLRIYSFTKFPLPTFRSTIEFFYFELILRLFPLGIYVVFESDCNNLLYELFLDLKVLILEKGLIINYKFKNPLSWIIFYIKEVYPIIRRGGLVFINAGDTKKQIITKSPYQNKKKFEYMNKIINSYKKINFVFKKNLFLKN